ncbi:MAG: hypothetical protein U1F98_04050 [Verrucomicrobiota bacterium]
MSALYRERHALGTLLLPPFMHSSYRETSCPIHAVPAVPRNHPFPARAAFSSSLYVFGEIVSSTTNALHSGWSTTNYYQLRNSTHAPGRGARRTTGIPFDITNDNWSYFGNPADRRHQRRQLPTPPDAANCSSSSGPLCGPFQLGDLSKLRDEYGPCGRIPLMPSKRIISTPSRCSTTRAPALDHAQRRDVTAAPDFGSLTGPVKIFTRQRVIDMNAQFLVTVSQATAQMPGLTIFVPDIFTLLDQAQTNAASFGLTNAIIDALDDPKLKNKSMTGPGASYVFWDQLNPTARFHVAIADAVEQVIAPTTLTGMAVFNGSNRASTSPTSPSVATARFAPARTSWIGPHCKASTAPTPFNPYSCPTAALNSSTGSRSPSPGPGRRPWPRSRDREIPVPRRTRD